MTMTKGEKAELTIEPEWGYGKKGNIDAGYPLIKAACTETLFAKCFQYYNKKSYKTEQVWYLTPFITKLIFSRGVASGGGGLGWGGSRGARDLPLGRPSFEQTTYNIQVAKTP